MTDENSTVHQDRPSGEGVVHTQWHDDERGRWARIIINRPTKLNALNEAMLDGLIAALSHVSESSDIRVVVLSAAGEKAWVGGADLNVLARLDRSTARAFITRVHLACQTIRDCPVPVIADLRGYCLGAGLELAASCDLRVASEHSHFGMPEVNVGVPSVVEAALLPRLIGLGHTQDLVLTGRVIDASTALSWGLVNAVHPLGDMEDSVLEKVSAVLTAAPNAIRAQKQLIKHWLTLSLDQAISVSIDIFEASFDSDEPSEYLRRFTKRR